MKMSNTLPEDTVYVIDDDEAARESLAFLIRSAGIKTRAFVGGAAFLNALDSLPPGCIVTDLRMPEVDGMKLLREIRRRENPMPVIVVTGQGDIPLAVQAMRLGALDFLEKPYDDAVMLRTVGFALKRHQEESKAQGERADILHRLESLSLRERQVLDGLVSGKPNKIIAYDLGISIRTIEIYRAHVMTKMGANSLSDLIRMTLIATYSEFPTKAAS
jgi:two-component system, LuxR family, response regulator FixJ